MTTESFDPIQLYAQLNPVSAERLERLADEPEREATWTRIIARRDAVPHLTRLPRRRLVAAVVAAVALAVPALAFSGVLGSLFSFSNQGTPVKQGNLSRVSSLDLSAATKGSVVQLADRDGLGIYAAKTAIGNLCYFTGPPDQSELKTQEFGGGCMNTHASSNFPSPSDPVYDISLFALAPGATGPSVQRLAGVAADGVASVQLLALSDCHVVATARVTGNVYVANNLPMISEAVIVARDTSGAAVWHEAVTPAFNANASSCGLGY
jgi:hypothetical protein